MDFESVCIREKCNQKYKKMSELFRIITKLLAIRFIWFAIHEGI